MKQVILFLISFLLNSLVFSQTKLPNIIATNTTLTKANSPYSIENGMTINAGATLTIEAGVVVKIAQYKDITVNGNLIVLGTKDDSVYFSDLTSGNPWGMINSNEANIKLYYLVNEGSNRFLSATGGDTIIISHCRIFSTATAGNGLDCIAAHDSKRVTIDSILLTGSGGTIAGGSKNDAIDLDAVDSCFIFNNTVSHFSDDAVDIGTQTKYADIENNILSYTNFGVTVGEQSVAWLYKNISIGNDGGIQSHNGAIVSGSNNILYSNTDGIECYHSEEGETVQSGGIIHLTNTIFYQNHRSDITRQSSSTVDITYCLSDKDTINGDYNLKGDPKFVDPANGDFHIQFDSPCINNGKPDISGNPTTIGVFDYTGPIEVNQVIDLSEPFIIYPNPCKDFFQIGTTITEGKIQVILSDLSGQIVKSCLISNKAASIDVHALPAGMYFVTIIYSNTKIGSVKIIKE